MSPKSIWIRNNIVTNVSRYEGHIICSAKSNPTSLFNII